MDGTTQVEVGQGREAFTVIEGGVKWSPVYYICHQCGETDVYLCLDSEVPPQAMNCWNCKAGKDFGPGQVSEQVIRRKGMLPATPEQAAAIISQRIDAKAGGREPKVI